ncbi:MAG: PilZ domain-containing protein [Candidatus Omnitrophica bacterium]|nr:PilZ domain-containing protein [Candidatus Omnitrophota bacterium]
MVEKRRHARLSSDEQTNILKPGGNASVKLIDISLGGMRVLMCGDLAVETSLKGQFSILPNMRPFYISGVVSWSRKAQEKDLPFTHEIGIKFSKISAIPLE